MFWARLRLILARADKRGLKSALRRAQNTFMPKNINSITIITLVRWPTRDTLQTKNDRCKQKRCAANKKRSLQTKKMRCKQKTIAANKKEEPLQLTSCARTLRGSDLVLRSRGSRMFPRNVLFMFSMFC